MNTLQLEANQPIKTPNKTEVQNFKLKVQQALTIDEEIAKYETKIRELKKLKNKQLEPQITGFMRQFNISDLNTKGGKLRCNVRNVKQALNKNNIRENLSKYMSDEIILNEALSTILSNREIKTTYKLTKPKK